MSLVHYVQFMGMQGPDQALTANLIAEGEAKITRRDFLCRLESLNVAPAYSRKGQHAYQTSRNIALVVAICSAVAALFLYTILLVATNFFRPASAFDALRIKVLTSIAMGIPGVALISSLAAVIGIEGRKLLYLREKLDQKAIEQELQQIRSLVTTDIENLEHLKHTSGSLYQKAMTYLQDLQAKLPAS